MHAIVRLLTWGLCLSLLATGSIALGRGKALDESFRVSGALFYKAQQISIGRMAYDAYSRSTFPGPYAAVYDVTGWDHFTAYIGMDDANPSTEKETVAIEVDGQPVWKNTIATGDRALAVDIALTGAKTLAITATANAIVIAEPKLTQGIPEPAHLVDQLVQALIAAQALAVKANQADISDLIAARFKELAIRVDVTEKTTTWQFTR